MIEWILAAIVATIGLLTIAGAFWLWGMMRDLADLSDRVEQLDRDIDELWGETFPATGPDATGTGSVIPFWNTALANRKPFHDERWGE